MLPCSLAYAHSLWQQKFNTSLKFNQVPEIWKDADVIPTFAKRQMRIERIVFQTEMSHVTKDAIHSDQFAYKEGHNAIIAPIKWLERVAKYFKVISYDCSKTFNSFSHDNLCEKLKKMHTLLIG